MISEEKYNSSIVTVVEWEHPENDGWAKINQFTVTVTITSSVNGNETRAVLPHTAYITAANCAGEGSIAFPIVGKLSLKEM